MKNSKNIIVAISGASGAIYGKRLFDFLYKNGYKIHLLVSRQGQQILKEELSLEQDYFLKEGVFFYENENINARIASGLFPCLGMVIVPASMGVIGRIASGTANDLISRAADVMLKEKGTLVMVPRETPIHQIHLQNMLTLSQAGAVILPASPGFYYRPETVEDLADFIVARVLRQLGIENNLLKPWEPLSQED